MPLSVSGYEPEMEYTVQPTSVPGCYSVLSATSSTENAGVMAFSPESQVVLPDSVLIGIPLRETGWVTEEKEGQIKMALMNSYTSDEDSDSTTYPSEEEASATVCDLRMILSDEKSPDGADSDAADWPHPLSSEPVTQENMRCQPEFANIAYCAVPGADGRYTISVVFSVCNLEDMKDLKISATCAGETQLLDLKDPEYVGVTFHGIQGRKEVELEITGRKTQEDVFVYFRKENPQPEGSLFGLRTEEVQISQKAKASPDRIVNVFLTSARDQHPLAGLDFQLYSVDPQASASDSPEKFIRSQNLVGSITTNIQGYASFNFTDQGIPDGSYVLVQKENPGISAPAEPLFLKVPGLLKNGAEAAYTQAIHLTNIPVPGPKLQMSIRTSGNLEASYGMEEAHTWILRSEIPADFERGESCIISGSLNPKLRLDESAFTVEIITKNGKTVRLQENLHFTQTVHPAEKEKGIGECFAISLTEEGRAFAAKNTGIGRTDPELRIRYRTYFSELVQPGERISGQAKLCYQSSVGQEYTWESNAADVYTGGATIQLTANEDLLRYKEYNFQIARATEEADLREDGDILMLRGERCCITYVPAYAVPDENGRIKLQGLAWGIYYLVVSDPDGMQTVPPVRFSVHKYSHLTAEDGVTDDSGTLIDNTIHVFIPERKKTEIALGEWINRFLSLLDPF